MEQVQLSGTSNGGNPGVSISGGFSTIHLSRWWWRWRNRSPPNPSAPGGNPGGSGGGGGGSQSTGGVQTGGTGNSPPVTPAQGKMGGRLVAKTGKHQQHQINGGGGGGAAPAGGKKSKSCRWTLVRKQHYLATMNLDF